MERKSGRRWLKGAAVCAALFALGYLSMLFGGDFNYRVIDNNTAVEITRFTARGRSASIPSHIGDLPVTVIGENSFRRSWGRRRGTLRSMIYALTSVTIPDTVTRIERYAFEGNRLSYVYIPYGVRHIGDWAFRANRISAVTIPDSVTWVGDQAFRHNRLAEVSVPRHATIAENAFDSGVTITRRD